MVNYVTTEDTNSFFFFFEKSSRDIHQFHIETKMPDMVSKRGTNIKYIEFYKYYKMMLV